MFSSLRRPSRLLRLRVAPSTVFTPSSLTLIHHAPSAAATTNFARTMAFASGATKRNLPSVKDLSEHEAILEDTEHEVETTEGGITRFQDLADNQIIDARVVKNITEGMGYDEMTKVQRRTVTSTVNGDDVLAQAKTGTGKTIAFLLPAIQRLLTSPEPIKPRTTDIRAVIISPTRELAIQIHKDALKLCPGTGIVCQAAVGGTGKSYAVMQMRREGCHILIATPGRLKDLLRDDRAGAHVGKVDTLVLDEGDTLLDQGFSEAIDEIIRMLPPAGSPVRRGAGRQSMVFSATMPSKVLEMVRRTLRKDYKFLKMVDKGEAAVHERVKQHLIKCRGFENILPSIYELVMKNLGLAEKGEGAGVVAQVSAEEPFKAIVFFPTTKFAALAAATFRNFEHPDGTHPLYKRMEMIEIHSRLTQGQRSKAAEKFRNSKSAILFASDVVARGMDFPHVTHVIQVCAPSSQEQYIHRLGRTGRAGRAGVGYILLTEAELAEKNVNAILHGMTMDSTPLGTSSISLEAEQQLTKPALDAIKTVTEASMKTGGKERGDAYLSLLGYFIGVLSERQVLIDCLNRWSSLGWGMKDPPHISPAMINKLGLTRVSGLNDAFVPREQREDGDGFSDRRGSGGSQRGGSSGRGGFGGGRDGGRGGRSFGGRPAFGDRKPRSDYGDRGDRPAFKPRGDFGGDRPAFKPRGDFGGRGDRGDRPSYGDRGDRPSYGDRGDRPSRGGFGGRGGSRGGFGNRGADRNRAPWMGRGARDSPDGGERRQRY